MMSQAQRLGALRLPDYRRFDPKRQAQLWASLNQDEKREVLHINRGTNFHEISLNNHRPIGC